MKRVRFTAQDLVWVLLFSVMIAVSRTRYVPEIVLLLLLLIVQVSESKLPRLEERRALVGWMLLKLFLGYLLIGYTGGLASSYYLVLLLPVVTGATLFGVVETLLISILACATYLSFLLFVDWTNYTIPPDQVHELVLRTVFLAMAGNLANMLADAVHVQSGNYRAVAEQLADANRHLRDAEAAVRRSDRLAALGQLSAGLAHELRNPLGTIKASAEMLGRSVPGENEVAREVAGFISSEVDRVNSLVTRFLDFARPLQAHAMPTDIATILDRAVAAVERDAPEIRFYKNYAPELPRASADADLIERVFYNLLLNAAQATPAGGVVTIKTRAIDRSAEISVIDRGCGIDPKLIDTIFNPFVTTKPRGVGLGLAIVSKIVDEHGGKIAVESEPGKGSIFRVYLPIA